MGTSTLVPCHEIDQEGKARFRRALDAEDKRLCYVCHELGGFAKKRQKKGRVGPRPEMEQPLKLEVAWGATEPRESTAPGAECPGTGGTECLGPVGIGCPVRARVECLVGLRVPKKAL